MVISYYGAEFFKITFGDITLAVNPISKHSNLKQTRFGADIVFVSVDRPDFNGVEQVSYGDKEPLVIDGPGEYESRGVFINGFSSDSGYGVPKKDKASAINTIYKIGLEGMNLCFLGALGQGKLGADAVEALSDIDVLFVPVGGGGVLNAHAAHELSVELEPAFVIPMHYGEIENDKNSLKAFLKEEGAELAKKVDRLTLKKNDLIGKSGEIAVLG